MFNSKLQELFFLEILLNSFFYNSESLISIYQVIVEVSVLLLGANVASVQEDWESQRFQMSHMLFPEKRKTIADVHMLKVHEFLWLFPKILFLT